MTLTPESPDGFLVCGFNTEKQDFVFLLHGHLVEFGSLKGCGETSLCLFDRMLMNHLYWCDFHFTLGV